MYVCECNDVVLMNQKETFFPINDFNFHTPSTRSQFVHSDWTISQHHRHLRDDIEQFRDSGSLSQTQKHKHTRAHICHAVFLSISLLALCLVSDLFRVLPPIRTTPFPQRIQLSTFVLLVLHSFVATFYSNFVIENKNKHRKSSPMIMFGWHFYAPFL